MGKQVVPSYWHLFTQTWRGRLSFVIFCGLCQAYAIRVVMSVSLQSIAEEYGYDNPTRGTILSAFFMGYICLQMAGGLVATKFGAFWVLFWGIFIPSALTVVTPWVCAHVPTLIAIRVMTGFAEGVTYPALHAMIGRWTPAHERSKLTSFMWSGGFFGTFTTMPFAGAIAGGSLSIVPGLGITGWRAVFYLYGAFGIAWSLLFALLASSSPETHRFISEEERRYIVAHRDDFTTDDALPLLPSGQGGGDDEQRVTKDKTSTPAHDVPVPWLALASCPTVWGCVIGQTTHNWGFYLLLTWLPQYMSQMLGFDVESAGVLSFLPYMMCFLGGNIGGMVCDWLIARGYPVVWVRRGAFTLGEVVPAIALATTGYITNVNAVLALLTIAVGFGGVSVPGIACTPLDIAPHLAGPLMGVMNTIGTISGIVAPIVVGDIVGPPAKPGDVQAQERWRTVFWMAAGINVAGWLAYTITCKGELIPSLQPTSRADEPHMGAMGKANEEGWDDDDSGQVVSTSGIKGKGGYDGRLLV